MAWRFGYGGESGDFLGSGGGWGVAFDCCQDRDVKLHPDSRQLVTSIRLNTPPYIPVLKIVVVFDSLNYI
jgi:hypothetical protein